MKRRHDVSPELLYLLAGDGAELERVARETRAADLADALNALPVPAAGSVLARIPFDVAVQVLDAPELERDAEILASVDGVIVTRLIEGMSADQQADLFRAMDVAHRNRLLPELSEKTQTSLKRLLQYPHDTAAGIMTTEFVDVPQNWTVRQTLDYVRNVARSKETIYAVYILDAAQRLIQVVSLRDIITADLDVPIVNAANRRKPITATPLTDREEAARLISKYNLLALPVVDPDGHILGIVTVDDIIDAVVAETTEDVQKFGGVEALDEPYTQISFAMMIRKRAGWLMALFIGEMLTATAMGHFEKEIASAVVLALFIPLIISSGGNSGSQATSLIIRALALREVEVRDWWRIALRELPAGLALGLILGFIGVIRILLWQGIGWYNYGPHYGLVALTVGTALIGVVTFGSLTGSMLPFLLRRLGFDPASASAPFVATLVDVTGIIIYFTVAYLILHGTLL